MGLGALARIGVWPGSPALRSTAPTTALLQLCQPVEPLDVALHPAAQAVHRLRAPGLNHRVAARRVALHQMLEASLAPEELLDRGPLGGVGRAVEHLAAL